jgi:SAM-dependent methyltransferase
LTRLLKESPELPDTVPAVGAADPRHPTFLQRIAFDVSLVRQWRGTDISIADIGGGLGLFSLAFAELGARATIVDYFPWEHRESMFKVFREHGVEVMNRDAIAEGIDFPDGSLDVVTSFHFMEHVHNSPKRLFDSMVRALKPDRGLFVLAGPNSVNLRKRVTAPIGNYKWSSMREWYETDVFRGHVREPDVDDLRYIVRDLGLHELGVYGRNFLGQGHDDFRGRLARSISPILERRPSLCSDIYIVAERRS